MNLSEHFTLSEFVRSTTAAELHIDNTMPDVLMPNALAWAAMMERIRAALVAQLGRDVPIILTSGFRCLPLNRAKRSKDSSDHPLAFAGDWIAPEFGTPYQICRFLAPRVDQLGIGQLIYEFDTWVHSSARMVDKLVNRIITINQFGTQVGIHQ